MARYVRQSVVHFITMLLLALALPVAAKTKLPETTAEGLHLVPDTRAAAVYLRPGADFSGFTEFEVIDCYVAFKKDWQREQNQTNPLRVTKNDMDRIKAALSDEFKKVFTKELAASGLTPATEQSSNVLVLRPAIIDLEISAPANVGSARAEVFAMDAGQMTLYLELYDGATSELLARVIDPERARSRGVMTWQTKSNNIREADRLLTEWSSALGAYLKQAREAKAPIQN